MKYLTIEMKYLTIEMKYLTIEMKYLTIEMKYLTIGMKYLTIEIKYLTIGMKYLTIEMKYLTIGNLENLSSIRQWKNVANSIVDNIILENSYWKIISYSQSYIVLNIIYQCENGKQACLTAKNVNDHLDFKYRCCGQQEYWWKLFKQERTTFK